MVAEIKPSDDNTIRVYILALKSGQMPDTRPVLPEKWESTVSAIERHYAKCGGDADKMKSIIETWSLNNPELEKLLNPPPVQQPLARVEDNNGFPALPFNVQFPPELAASASPWLNTYTAFSRKWSPRGYEGYHEAVGMSLLSALAGHRVSYAYGQKEYTPLYISLVGFTTLFKKTTTARLYYGLLNAAKLDWILGANITTPQKLLSDMAGKAIPGNYDDLPPEEQERTKKRLAMCAQRGWYYDEFGLHLDQMNKDTGVMSDFKGLLRILDDCMPVFESTTHARGLERIERPYLSLLASMTPADIRPHASKDSKFWRDGLFARFCFVCPPKGHKGSRDRFPKEQLLYPSELVQPLLRWHDWLGIPEIDIETLTNQQGNITGHCINQVKEFMERECTSSAQVDDAIERYEWALLDMVEGELIPEALYGSYGRLHKIALRIAMLLASLENGGRIELRHWAKGQEFAEARRRDLHELFAQVNTPEIDNSLEDNLFAYFSTLEGRKVTASEIKQYGPGTIRKMSSALITKTCLEMAKANRIEKENIPGKIAQRFFLLESEEPLQG